MNLPFISIIIPTYNAAETLEACLTSILSQTYKNFEIVVIDGVSTDNTLVILENYSIQLPIKLVSEEDNGIYDAMNKALPIAEGEWLYFLGADDRLYDEHVLSNITSKMEDGIDIIYGNSVWWPENVKEEGEWDYRQLLKRSINHQRIFYRSNLFKRVGNYNTRYKIAADYALNIRLFCEPSVRQEYIDLPVAYYHSGGFTGNKIDEDFWNDWERISVKSFSPYLSRKEIYLRRGWYCWYNIDKKKYASAFYLFCTIYKNTFSYPFVKHTISQIKQTIKRGLNRKEIV